MNDKKFPVLSIMSLIFSIVLFPVGLILTIINLIKLSELNYREDYNHVLTYISAGICVCWIILVVLTGKSGSSISKDTQQKAQATIPTVEAEETTTPDIKTEVADIQEEITEPIPESDPLENFTLSQKNAIKAAQDYLEFQSFSRAGLIHQLSSEYGSQFPEEDAVFAVEYLEQNNLVDWNEQAVKAAQSYLENQNFSRDGLIQQLSSEYGSQFTPEQAEYAVDQIGL